MVKGVEPGVAGQIQARALWNEQIGGKSQSNIEKLGFGKLSGSTMKYTNSPQNLSAAKEIFSNHLRTEVKAMTEGMSPQHVKQFTERAEATLNSILDKTFDKMETRLQEGKTIKDPHVQFRKADKLAKAFLKELEPEAIKTKTGDLRTKVEGRLSNPQTSRPQLVRAGNQFTLVRTAPQIESLVLKGGGAKGIGYPPALSEMQRSGMLNGLKQVVGTSAGALTAVSVAVGQSAEELKSLANQDLGELLKTDKSLRSIYPEIGFSNTAKVLGTLASVKGGGHGEANPMIALLDKVLGDKVEQFLAGMKPGEIADMAEKYAASTNGKMTKEQVLERLAVLNSPNYEIDRSGKMVTFSDMRMLHAMAPDQFKEIQLTGYDMKDKAGVLFNADKFPDLPVAFAARASMAHPLIATGVTLNPKFGLGNHTIADGGISSNTPSEAVYGGDVGMASIDSQGVKKLEETHAKTLVMVFDDKGKAYTALHGAPETRETGAGKIEKWVAKNPNRGADKLYDKAKEYGAGPNTFIVFHGKIGTLDTSANEAKKQFAEAQASLHALEQINNRLDSSYGVTHDSVESAFKSLTSQEKDLIFKAGPPKREDYGAKLEANFVAEGMLYDLVKKEIEGR